MPPVRDGKHYTPGRELFAQLLDLANGGTVGHVDGTRIEHHPLDGGLGFRKGRENPCLEIVRVVEHEIGVEAIQQQAG